MASQNRTLSRVRTTVDAPEDIWVKVELLEGVDGLESGGFLYLYVLVFLLCFLHAVVGSEI
jgi:hypothetical protein